MTPGPPVEWLPRPPSPRGKTVKTVLVYDGEIDPALEEDGFFDYLVSSDQLLGK